MSLSQAYRHTLAAYHAIQAEREHRIRYANYEARTLGADMGPSETDRGFIKEQRALDLWATVAGRDTAVLGEEPVDAGASARKKRVDSAFTGGQAYLAAAEQLSSGHAASPRAPSTPKAAPDATESDDFLGIARALR